MMDKLSFGAMPNRHMMIDIESYDTAVTAAILAIGAVVFNPRGDVLEDSYHVTISREDNEKQGRTVSQSTVDWWSQQDQDAQDSVFKGPHIPLNLALANFARWANRLQPTCTRIWAMSPDFDCNILIHACSEQNVHWPFKFWEGRCVRTVKELAYANGDFPYIAMEGPKHDALADAKLQATQVQHAYYVLGV